MAVDKALLESCIAEASGDDSEMAAFLRERYTKNDSLAAKFVGGYTRTQDYTQKTQALANERKTFQDEHSQLENVRKALEAAETEKNSILRELAGHRIGTAKARELMKVLQEKYQLTDEDLPGMSDLIDTAKKGKPVDSTDDLDTRLSALEESLTKKLEARFVGAMTPEIGAMANLPLIWNEISREHEELTGKRLTFAEQQDILKAARDGTDSSMGKGSIYGIWQDKYQIAGDSGLRMKKRDEKLKADWASEREAADAAARSKQALEVVTPAERDLGAGPGISQAFKTQFKRFDMDPAKPGTPIGDGVPSLKVEPGQHVRQTGDRGPSGAQRAAMKYLEGQRNKGGGGGKAA